MNDVITLITDFGIADAYVRATKGAILGVNPDTQVVDINHQVQPQNIFKQLLYRLLPSLYFPRSTVHMAAVDPDVGTSYRVNY